MRSVLQDYLDSVLEALAGVDSGEVADYIPELATVNPDGFGIALVTTDGHLYHSGDTGTEFTIQSMSKPFTYGMALAEHGLLRVSSKIDVEPSGDAFNEISLDPVSNRPRNPMINAGAITAASLSGPGTADERFARIQRTYSAFAGRELTLDQEVYASEHRTGDRNRAIGYMLKGGGILEEDPEEALSVYFRQCSLSVTAIDMAYMAATLAGSGVNPKTGERVLEPQLVERVLSVMTTCGMYDGAGDWVTEVGLPAKSGVGGGIIAVLPGQFGIAVYSPRLDQHGNSVRGVQVCRRLSRELGLHFMHVPRSGKSAVHGRFTVDESPSRRARTIDQQDVLDREGHRALVLQAQGDLFFAGAEAVSRAAAEASADVDLLVLDLTAVDDLNSVAAGMLLAQRRILALQECRFLVVDPEGLMAAAVDGSASPWGDAVDPPLVFSAVEEAVRWSEDWLLDRYGDGAVVLTELTLAEHPLFRQLSAAAQAALTPLIDVVDYADGETIIRRGEPAQGVFLILAGTAYTGAGRLDGASDLLPGASFGEMVTVAGRPHLADVSARGPLRVAVLRTAAYRQAEREEPSALLELLEVLVRSATQTVERAVRGQEAARR